MCTETCVKKKAPIVAGLEVKSTEWNQTVRKLKTFGNVFTFWASARLFVISYYIFCFFLLFFFFSRALRLWALNWISGRREINFQYYAESYFLYASASFWLNFQFMIFSFHLLFIRTEWREWKKKKKCDWLIYYYFTGCFGLRVPVPVVRTQRRIYIRCVMLDKS